MSQNGPKNGPVNVDTEANIAVERNVTATAGQWTQIWQIWCLQIGGRWPEGRRRSVAAFPTDAVALDATWMQHQSTPGLQNYTG